MTWKGFIASVWPTDLLRQSAISCVKEFVFFPNRQGHLPMVIQLIRYGADPTVSDGEGYRALHLAILFQHMAIAAYLMAKGQVRRPQTHTDTFNCNTLWLLFLKALVEFYFTPLHFQEVDGPDCNGQTPLMLAAQKIIGWAPVLFTELLYSQFMCECENVWITAVNAGLMGSQKQETCVLGRSY